MIGRLLCQLFGHRFPDRPWPARTEARICVRCDVKVWPYR